MTKKVPTFWTSKFGWRVLFWNMNRAESQKSQGKYWLRIGTQGGRPYVDTKVNPALESFWGKRLRGADAKKGVDVLAEGRGEVIICRRRDAVSDIWDQFWRKWTPTCNGLKYDKIRPQYVRQKDTKDTIGRYIVLLPEEKTDSRQRDSEWWHVLSACTYIVIDDGVTRIGNTFDRGSARIGEITFLITCPFYNWRLTYTLTATKSDRIGLSSI